MINSKHSRSVSSEISPKASLTSPRSMQEKKVSRNSEMQFQIAHLEKELKKARDEKTRALEDLEELRSNKKFVAFSNKEEMEALEKKLEKSKESERKMLESLKEQTKQLEQAKISLEEAKLEVKILQENMDKKSNPIELIRSLKNELKLATEAEDKSKKAMDDLAMALKEVTMENNQVKEKLSSTESELEKVKHEFEQSKDLVKITNEKLRSTIEESEKCKLEHEEMVAKMKKYKDEIAKLKEEKDKANEGFRGSREETSKLRDILKQAINEATVVKDGLEIARKENSRLNDLLKEKEDALEMALKKQDSESVPIEDNNNECVNERVRNEPNDIDVGNSSTDDYTRESTVSEANESKKSIVSEVNESKKTMKYSSERYLSGDSRIPKNELFGSVSNLTGSRVSSSIYEGEGNGYEEYEDCSPSLEKKKKTMIRRFGDLLRGRSVNK